MALTYEQAKSQLLAILHDRYPNWATKKNGDKVLCAMSALAKDIKVREVGGNNRGPWVEVIIGSTGLDPKGEYAWCAASIEFCCDVCGITVGPADPKTASVAAWRTWAKANNRLSKFPARGKLGLYVNANGTGHIGVVAEVKADGKLRTYEGNTSSGDTGSQRDGGGLYHRTRKKDFFKEFIDLD